MDPKLVVERIAGRYPGRWTQGYVRGKIGSDPVYPATLDLLRDSALPVLDIGCGMGLLSFYLREFGFSPRIAGLDYDAEKIISAREIAQLHYRDLVFEVQDALEEHVFSGNIVILDVLQYLEAGKQHALLSRVTTMIPPGGLCVIRGTPRTVGWRFQFTRWMDYAMHFVGWMKSRAMVYLLIEEISAPFLAAGFVCEVRPLWGRTPFNSHLFVFTRPDWS